jgi:serine/threonine protein kinase
VLSATGVESVGAPWLRQDVPVSGVSEVAEVSKAPETEWSANLVYHLEGGDEAVSRLAGQVRQLDVETVASVTRAVEMLNLGSIDCPEDMCIVYSKNSRGYYLLYRRGKREAALARMGAPEQQLYAGLVLMVGGGRCKVTTALGTGSFGTVWAAECLEGGPGPEVAVKEILCRSSVDLANAEFEGKLLEMIQSHARACGSSCRPDVGREAYALGGRDPLDRIPDLVGIETEICGEETWRVRLAMTRVPGISLDRFLVSRCRRLSGSYCSGSALGSSTRLQQQGPLSFVEACGLARELILQLSPALDHISKLSYHRDVNSHNILIDGSPSSPVFGLVDFGLAVDLTKWQGPMGPLSWQLIDIGGDCRYWPMSAWLQFECGWKELSKYPPLSHEYQTQLDFHALGITALQILAALSPPATKENTGSITPHVRALQVAWDQYWQNVTCFWQRLLEVFRTGGDQNALKVACINERVHNIVGANLAALRSAMRKLFDACNAAGTEAHLRQLCPLFAALLELVSSGGTVGFKEGQDPPSWQVVYKLISVSEPHCSVQEVQMEPHHFSTAVAPGLHCQLSAVPLSQRSLMASARTVR